jgi:Cellulose binding domain
MRQRHIAIAATVAVAGAGLIVAGATAATAAAACTVDYTVSEWSSGFTADVKVTNNGSPVTSWTLGWTYAGNQQITSGWNASVTQTGSAVTASSNGWNGALATGASASFGFQGTSSGANVAPTNFTFNGASCSEDAESAPTTPATTAPTDPVGSAPTSAPVTTPPTGRPSVGGDSFEDQTGTTPSGNWSIATPDCSGTGTATIDKTVAHTGSASLKINGGEGYCNHVFAKNTALLSGTGKVWYIRYWVRHTTALPVSHVTAVAMTDANDGNKDLRFGGQNSAMQFNRASDDATLPEQSPSGVALSKPLPVNSWNCIEFKISGADGTIETWLNGTTVTGLVADGTPTHDIDSQWLNKNWRPALTDLKLGWESYGGGTDTLWYDDVAVSASRNGC